MSWNAAQTMVLGPSPLRRWRWSAAGWLTALLAWLFVGLSPLEAGPHPQQPPAWRSPARAAVPDQARAAAPAQAKPAAKPQAKPATPQPQAKPAAKPQAKPQPPAPTPARPPGARKTEKIPPPEEISGGDLITRDGVTLCATFYPGTKGKESVPVLLLHNWKSSRREFAALAPQLQQLGCAVLVPDLRGHGASTRKIEVYRGKPREVKLDATKFRATEFAEIATLDMAALRSFLLSKNNAEELNLNKLVIVGSEMGAAVAMVWSAYDWSLPNYEHAGIKQSQDVKALVLISPKWSYTGLDTAAVLNAKGISPVRDRLSVMILVGQGDSEKARDAERIEGKMVLNRPQPEARIDRTVLRLAFDTTLQAEKLLNLPPLNFPAMICRFIEERVIKGETNAAWMKHQ
ncbi:MAG: alpha/beta fold hydrolase [Thermoguttaceae bacterium]|jgi:pimeloyl-ACP methyl ester carboxylesterase